MEEGSSHWVDIILDQDLTSENKLRRLLNDIEFRNMMADISGFTGLDDGKKINEFKEALSFIQKPVSTEMHRLSGLRY